MKPIKIKNLKKKFKDTVAINNINLEIEQGKITGIIGSNMFEHVRTCLNMFDPI